MELANALDNCSKQLYSLVAQYGTACLLGDKNNASSFNHAINDSLRLLDDLIVRVAKLEKSHVDHTDMLEELGEA